MKSAIILLLASIAWAAGLAAWPRAGQPVVALFPEARGALARAVASGAEFVLEADGARVVALSGANDFPARLYRNGALLVLRSPSSWGCAETGATVRGDKT